MWKRSAVWPWRSLFLGTVSIGTICQILVPIWQSHLSWFKAEGAPLDQFLVRLGTDLKCPVFSSARSLFPITWVPIRSLFFKKQWPLFVSYRDQVDRHDLWPHWIWLNYIWLKLISDQFKKKLVTDQFEIPNWSVTNLDLLLLVSVDYISLNRPKIQDHFCRTGIYWGEYLFRNMCQV